MMMKSYFLAICVCLFAFTACAQVGELKSIQLPEPGMTGGKPLMEALKDRKTDRSFSKQELELQMISDLLWATYGINRPADGKRTAPSAGNKQEFDVYVCIPQGIYLYHAKDNKLEPVVAGDHRAKMGKQTFTADAPLTLVFVADYSRMGSYSKEAREFYSAVDVGYISQNAYLYCASEGLATVALGFIDRELITETLNLKGDFKVVLSQCVGFPAK
jgi:SagB-type dehydrogenase family enzyme